jgi:asparagine synthase (glutamine-hydrolysing)
VVSQIQECIKSLDLVKYRGPDSLGIALINVKTGQSKIIEENNDSGLHEGIGSIKTIITNQEYHLLLGHRRLSIIDLSDDGFQPMRGDDGSIICFNGEIYNFKVQSCIKLS